MNKSKLKGVLAENNCSQESLGKLIGVSSKTANAKINGKASFTVEEANIIAKHFNIENPCEIFFD